MKKYLKKIYIPKQENIFNHKDELRSYGLVYSKSNDYWHNHLPLEIEDLDSIKWLCDKNSFIYKVEEIEVTDSSIYEKTFEIKMINEDTFLISNIHNTQYIINLFPREQYFTVVIFDCKNSSSAKLKIDIDSYDKLSEIIDIYLSNKNVNIDTSFDSENFLSVITAVNSKRLAELNIDGKIRAFKFSSIENIRNKKQGNFLCNAVDGFLPHRHFYIRGNRIIDETNNYIEKKQESKIWKYLYKYENRKYIALKKEPTFQQLYYGKKIQVRVNGTDETVVITNIRSNVNRLLTVTVTNGINTTTLPVPIEQHSLDKMIID